MQDVLFLIRIILAAIFALAGIGKLLDLAGSEKAVKGFGVPEVLAKPISVILPFAEITIAVLLIPVTTSFFGAFGGFLLLAAFSLGMIVQMAKGNAPDCHCFGQFHSEPVSKKSLIRNLAFLFLSIVLVAHGRENQGRSFLDFTSNNSEGGFMQLFFGLAMVGLLVATVYFLKKISEQQTQVIRRLEILEITASEGKQIEREEAASPENGLPIGSFAPAFSLPDLNGREFSLADLLAPKRALLMFFVSPTCSPCNALLPEIEAWQQEFKGTVDLVFLSSGKPKDNAEKLGGKSLKQILLQKDREVANEFGAKWTPTAVLVNSEGRIASRAAAGDEAIRKLVEQIRAAGKEQPIAFVRAQAENGNGKGIIGEQLPEFSLEDIAGNVVSSQNLKGARTLLTNWSLGCGYCKQMLDDLRAWDTARSADDPRLILFSDGGPEDNLELGLSSTILLDKEKTIPNALALNGTPTAVLVDENGTIISDVAVGAKEIFGMVRRNKDEG